MGEKSVGAVGDGAPAGAEVGAAAGEERLTEDLLEHLLEASSPEAYLDTEGIDDNREFTDYLFERLAARGGKRAAVVRESGLNPTVVYDIFQGKSRPGRDHAVMLAFGLHCDLRQAQRLLRLAGVSELWCKQRRDAILIWCIDRGYTREQADDELFRLGEKTLLGTGRLG